MESDGDHFLAYYLTKDDDGAHTFKSKRLQGGPDTASAEVLPSVLILQWLS